MAKDEPRPPCVGEVPAKPAQNLSCPLATWTSHTGFRRNWKTFFPTRLPPRKSCRRFLNGPVCRRPNAVSQSPLVHQWAPVRATRGCPPPAKARGGVAAPAGRILVHQPAGITALCDIRRHVGGPAPPPASIYSDYPVIWGHSPAVVVGAPGACVNTAGGPNRPANVIVVPPTIGAVRPPVSVGVGKAGVPAAHL